ncbi:MAG TPA: DUF1127 domain-containing protein [Falsiroseomonas sp.]|jgi:uncharacterized protein YjiS (DUF1127 family)|nr:DUF1127 domain-containing protein [Falsiroseomonas sp.]
MDPRRHQEQIGLFSAHFLATGLGPVDVIRAQAAQARDAAIGAGLRRAAVAIWQVLAAIGSALVTFPIRRSTYESLRQLTDRELADIGLTRGDIHRVFEPDFRMPMRPANTNQAPAAVRPQAA